MSKSLRCPRCGDSEYRVNPGDNVGKCQTRKCTFQIGESQIRWLRESHAELLAACENTLPIIQSMPAPTLGGWNWPYVAERLRAAVAKAKAVTP